MTEPHDPDTVPDGTPPVGNEAASGGPGNEAVSGGSGNEAVSGGSGSEAVSGGDEAAGLGARERAVLAMEGQGWPGPGAKERAIREQLGLSPTRYYQLLNALLDDPAAARHAPVTVNRLRRVREAQRDRR